MRSLTVGLVQLTARSDLGKEANLRRVERLVGEAARRGARLVALPEYVTCLDAAAAGEVAEPIPGPTTAAFAALAERHGVYLLGGSIHERSDHPGKHYNTSTLFAPDGELLASYRKIHLFDVEVGTELSYRESDTIVPGEDVVTADVDGHRVGLTICYDLRFPELYRRLAVAGAEVVFVPSAFALVTGKDHWEVLLRARAIENHCYVVAPSQIGQFGDGGWAYGRSLVADPWGTVVAQASDGEGVVTAELDFDLLARVREQVPALANRRLDVGAPAPERVAAATA